MTYIIAATAASVLFVAAGWRSRQTIGETSFVARADPNMNVVPPAAVADPAASGAIRQDDVSSAIYIALARLAPVIASQSVKIDVAVHLGLKAGMRGHALADMLEELLAIALHAAPASRLLLAAWAQGDRIHIAVTDDMPTANLAHRQGLVRTLTERAATRGCGLLVEVRPGEGATMTLRLAAASDVAAADQRPTVAGAVAQRPTSPT
jgi:hypothetical protein